MTGRTLCICHGVGLVAAFGACSLTHSLWALTALLAFGHGLILNLPEDYT